MLLHKLQHRDILGQAPGNASRDPAAIAPSQLRCIPGILTFGGKHVKSMKRCWWSTLPRAGPSPAGGQWCPVPLFEISALHFTFGPPVAAYIQRCIFKIGLPFCFVAPLFVFWPLLLLNPGDGPGHEAPLIEAFSLKLTTIFNARSKLQVSSLEKLMLCLRLSGVLGMSGNCERNNCLLENSPRSCQTANEIYFRRNMPRRSVSCNRRFGSMRCWS